MTKEFVWFGLPQNNYTFFLSFFVGLLIILASDSSLSNQKNPSSAQLPENESTNV